VIEVMAPGVDEPDKDLEFRKLRAVLNANIGACFVKLVRKMLFLGISSVLMYLLLKGDHKEAVEACTEGPRVLHQPLVV